jgi:hypothetical protein
MIPVVSYQFRIPVEQSYLSALGRATYNFAYLEWGIVWIVEKLRPGYLNKVRGQTAGQIAREFENAAADIPDPQLNSRIATLASLFDALVSRRNQLVHGNPISATGGEQRLLYYGKSDNTFEWSEADILQAALDFEAAAIEANDIFHNNLA